MKKKQLNRSHERCCDQDAKIWLRPPLGLSSVLKLKPSDHESPVRPLLAMLPGRQSGEEEIVAHLSALRARIPGWLHQDEFGPSRREQTAALRTLKRSIGRLHLQLSTGAPRFRARLDMELRNSSDALARRWRLLERRLSAWKGNCDLPEHRPD